MWPFTNKTKRRIKELEAINKSLANRVQLNIREIAQLHRADNQKNMAALMRESLGLAVDFSAASQDKCLPSHFLEGLEEDERKNFITDMESVWSNERFQHVVRYMINLFATNAVYKADPDQMKNGQIAVVAFRTFLKEFDKMHIEFEGYKKVDEEFDDQAILAE